MIVVLEGWQRLCGFLDEPIPSRSFPVVGRAGRADSPPAASADLS